MKTKCFIFGLLIAAIGVLASCEGMSGGSASSMQFKRMNIAGAKAIALASDGSSQQNAPRRAKADGEDPEYNVSNPVWTVSDDGELIEVHYTIEVVGNGEIVDMVKANMRLVMQYIYPIGNDWLWLVNCEYDYPELDKVPEPLHGKIRELMHHNGDFNMLVRKSDGALFEWSREQGCPGRGMGYKRPSDVYGEVEAVGRNIFSSPSKGGVDDYYGRLYKLDDQGDVLNVVQVLSSQQQAVGLYVDERGFIGTYLNTMGVEIPVILDPTSLKLNNINTGDAQLGWSMFVTIGGETYLYGERGVSISHNDGKESWDEYKEMGYFYALDNQSGIYTVKTPALYEFDRSENPIKLPKTIYKSPTATWMGEEYDANWNPHAYIYTFDPKAPSLTKKALPAHYPVEEDKYYDGIAYVMAEDNSCFYVCDLSKDQAEQVAVVFDESVAEYVTQIAAMSGFGEYDPNTQCFTAGAQLLDGTYLLFILETQGENRGHVRALHSGESDAGQVISVMVRLN